MKNNISERRLVNLGAIRQTIRLCVFFSATLCVAGVPAANAFAAPTTPQVTDHVQSLSASSQTNVPVTFGQIFKSGSVPRGATLTATLDGKPIALQVDPKATNPDGSLRHAVLTVSIPSLPADATLPLQISTTTTGVEPKHKAVSLSQLLATNYDATVAINMSGQRYTVNVRDLLQAAAKANVCKAWDRQCNTWLSGPLVSEWVVHGPAMNATGSKAPHLEIYFAVRTYADTGNSAIGKVRTDIIVGNTDAFAAQGQPQYTATLSSGSASYTSPALTQYAYTRWHHVLWWNAARPSAYLRQDTRYIQATKAIPRYMSLTPSKKFLAGLRQTCGPLKHCDQTAHMGNEGAQPSIGPLPRWTSVYILDPGIRAYRWMLANTDALGAYSIHYRDDATGFPVSIHKHPYVTIANWGGARNNSRSDNARGRRFKADLLATCVNNSVVKDCDHPWYETGNPYKWDNAHQPAESYVPYMVTGSWYYMSELAFGASHNALYPNQGYRGRSKGLIDRAYGQIRGKAWVLREMVDAAWLLPDHYPLKREVTTSVENSLALWNAKYTHNPAANTLGVLKDGPIYSVHGKRNAVAPWQHNFLTWSVGHAAALGFKGAAAFRDWLAKFELGLMTGWQTDPTHGYCWLEASAYKIAVKDASGNWLPSYTAVYDATFPTLAGLACNSPKMVAAMGTLEKRHWKRSKMYGYPYSPTGFPANFQIGLAAAVDTGLPGADAAWRTFESRSVKPNPPRGYNNYPNFAIVPRSMPQ